MKTRFTNFAFALLFSWLCCAGAVAKPLHHYVFFGMDREKIKDAKAFLETEAFEGAQVAYGGASSSRERMNTTLVRSARISRF